MTLDTKTKVLLGAVIAAIIAFLIHIQGGLSPTPEPSGSPTPTPSLSVSPSPSPSVSPSPVAELVFKGVVGETVGDLYVAHEQRSVPPGFRAYEVLEVETRIPSFKGAAVGKYEDPLKPVASLEAGKKYWVETTLGSIGAACGSFVCTFTKAGPMKTAPFYSELSHAEVGRAHGLADTSTTQAARFALTLKYAALLRAHGVEPIKQFYVSLPPIANGKLDLDKVAFTGAKSFRDMVITGAIAPPMIVGPNLTNIPADFVAALKASTAAGDLPADAWVYAWDEGEGVVDAAALARAQLLKPTGLKVMETRNVTDAFAPYVDWFCPVVSAVQPGWRIGCAYVSCMSQGNCQNKTSPDQVAAATGDPMFVLDAPAVHARAFPWVLARLGAPRGLYYMSNKQLSTAWNPGGQYNEGGNGDGTFLYPGTDGNPWPSLRLKRLQRGLQDQWYRERGAGAGLVTSSKIWNHDEAAYESERLRVWEALP